MNADDVIRKFDLSPLPWEGGWYRETWRSTVNIPGPELGDQYEGERSAGTAIYYVLTSDTVSRMHRLPSDETFHFYLGDPVEMLLLHSDSANSEIITFGQDIFGGDHVQFTIPGNTLMGGRLKPDAAVKDAVGFALMGTTVSPGFDFADLEMGTFNDLAAQYPDRKELIKALS
jgi:predicted cupin superfamily sugar epimerase